jgi:hypothetical protein
MKAKKKPRGIKQKIREEKEREQRIALKAITAVILITVISISCFLANLMLNQASQTENYTSQLKAAIVDHLSLTMPNQTFIQTATNTLKQANYTVDYYPSEQVTVEFYRNLPTHGYKVILLRVHSAGTSAWGEAELQLFTLETYSNKRYPNEQIAGQVGKVKYSATAENSYFGICPNFVKQCMKGKFQNTIIIAMGCDSLAGSQMANAFIENGAKVYIGWSGSVLGDHTDQATIRLLQHLLLDKQTIDQAGRNTLKEVGADPANESVLGYYPSDVGDQTTEDIFSK